MERYAMLMDQRLHIYKMAIFPQIIYRVNATTIKIPTVFFFPAEIDELILEFLWKCKGSQQPKQIWKRNKVRELTLSHFQTFYTESAVLTYNRHIDQWNRIENSETKSAFIVNWFLTRVPKQFNRERMVFLITVYAHAK